MAFWFVGAAAAAVIGNVLQTLDDAPRRREASIASSMRAEVERMREEVDRERRNLERSVQREEQRREKALARLARRTRAIRMHGKHIGIFGLTSTGKSTMVNSLLGRKVAATGVGETTTEMTQYQGTGYTLWDAPGRNDELNYSNGGYISLLKGLTRRLILIQYTVKENLQFMRLLDDLGLGYDIIVNKFDDVDEDERSQFQRQIQREIASSALTGVRQVFFLSAQYPKMFSSWVEMVNYFTSECHDYDTCPLTDTDSGSD